jgi:hypothetical protein
MPVLLVSFCNVFPPGLALGLYDFVTGAFQWLDLSPSGDDLRGVTGLTYHDGRYWCLAQIYRPGFGLVSLDDQFQVAATYDLGRLREAHSLTPFNGGLLIAETGRNRLVWVETPCPGQAPRVEEYWRHNDQNSDVVHLNAVAVHAGEVYVSLFGERPEEGWRLSRKGQIVNVTRNQVVYDDLAQPHSLLARGGDLLWLESATGQVHRVAPSGAHDVLARLDGFVRGLAATDDSLYVAASMARRRSRSMGTANAPATKAADKHSWLYRLDRAGTLQESRKLSSIGAEIYDVLVVPSVNQLAVDGVIDPVVQRIWQCEDEFTRLGDRLRLALFQKDQTIQALARSLLDVRGQLRALREDRTTLEMSLRQMEEALAAAEEYLSNGEDQE